MKNFSKSFILSTLAVAGILPGQAQHFDMTQWGSGRGWTSAPYFRYEAEPGHCRDYNGTYLPHSDYQRDVQSEASNQQAIRLGAGGFVEWNNDSGDADGVTIRYSVPWGQNATVGVYVGDTKLGELYLDTSHNWQSCPTPKDPNRPELYSRHEYDPSKLVRMQYDERHTRLSRAIARGENFQLRHISGAEVTVDFLEIEKTVKTPIPAGAAVCDTQDVNAFIWSHQGQTIYVPEGDYTVSFRMDIPANTRVIGAGVWYTNIYFSNGESFKAGFGPFLGSELSHMYVHSVQSQRYNSGDYGPGGYASPGKALNGNCSNSNIHDLWVEHFECGAWLEDTYNVQIRNCRFRNNYADGINLAHGCTNSTVEQCNFRNNGDDDMAAWCRESATCHDNTYRNCTAEHNWRASSLGFFGGYSELAENILIKDNVEQGVRHVTDFAGSAFSGEINFRNISIVHSGCTDGNVGEHGDFWGWPMGALHIESTGNYDIQTANFNNIDLYNSRGYAVLIGSVNTQMHGVTLDGVNVHGLCSDSPGAFWFSNPRGDLTMRNCSAEDIDSDRLTNWSVNSELGSMEANGFKFTSSGCDFSMEPPADLTGVNLTMAKVSWQKMSRANDASADLSEGDNVVFQAIIANFSDVSVPAGVNIQSEVRFSDGTVLPMTTITDGLEAQTYKTVSSNVWAATPGAQTVQIVLDPNGRINGDTDGDDNVATRRFNVIGQEADNSISDSFSHSSGVDFQVTDLLWQRVDASGNFIDATPGRGPIATGDRLVFTARVANAGDQDARSGVKIGVKFVVDGEDWDRNHITWCDTYNSGLAAKSLVSLTANSGGQQNGSTNGQRYWVAKEGSLPVMAWVNDGNDYADESDKNNNQFTVSLPSIPYSGGVFTYHPDSMVDLPDDISSLGNSGLITAVSELPDSSAPRDAAWHTMTGIRLPSAPTQPGLYLHAGKTIIIR